MLTRNCIKITSVSSRTLLFRKYLLHGKRFSVPCPCLYNFSEARSIATTLSSTLDNTASESQVSQLTKNANSVSSQIMGNSEELLEKMIAGLSSDIHQKNRVYRNDLSRVISKVKELNFSTKKQGLLLLQCCTELLPDEPAAVRMALAEEVWTAIKPHTKFTVEHYNGLLRVYIANARRLKTSTFIDLMAPVKPNITTYELILKALGEAGDINQATEVIANMKSQGFPATESVFNSLIVCQGRSGNAQNIQEVLTMMKSLKFDITIDTHTAIARVLAFTKNASGLMQELEKAKASGLRFEEVHVMEIVKSLAAVGMYGTVPQVLRYLPETTLRSPSISPYMQSVCTWLVFQNHPLVALEIYKCLPLPSFGPKDDQGLHGRSLVRDCVKAAIPSAILTTVTRELTSTGRNPIALHNAAECALQLGRTPLALELFAAMREQAMPLRPHYFWPVLLTASRSSGEKGILSTLAKMVEMNVKPDYDTIAQYTLPYVSFTSPQNLMKKFQDAGLSVSMVLTPMMETLLNTGQVRAASEICELFKGKVDMELLIKPLIKGFNISMDLKSTLRVLEDGTQRATDKSRDWAGRFLCAFARNKRNDANELLKIIKELKNTPVRISTSAADLCISNLPESIKEEKVNAIREAIIAITDERIVDEGELLHSYAIPHPKHMNEESLKAHLIELEAKGMNTRGVLRRLLQQYCKEGNLQAAREIADKCQKEGILLSAGMKAAIFDLHVKSNELELAEIVLADLNKTSPNFSLDEFKVIDFATHWVCRKEIEKAFSVIQEQSKKRHVTGGRGISMNCFRLLDATANHGTLEHVKRMLDLLTSLRYCQPSNAMLGPVIRWHLNHDKLPEAVEEFTRLAHKYNKTPLKHELLCRLLQTTTDGENEKFLMSGSAGTGKLVRTVLNVNRKIHGPGDVQLTIIAALAEVGHKNTLRRMFLDPAVKFHPAALLRRCERFADEKKLHALETIAECARDTRRVDTDEVYDLIQQVHKREDDWRAALSLWEKMQESDIRPSQKFVRELRALLAACARAAPPALAAAPHDEARL